MLLGGSMVLLHSAPILPSPIGGSCSLSWPQGAKGKEGCWARLPSSPATRTGPGQIRETVSKLDRTEREDANSHKLRPKYILPVLAGEEGPCSPTLREGSKLEKAFHSSWKKTGEQDFHHPQHQQKFRSKEPRNGVNGSTWPQGLLILGAPQIVHRRSRRSDGFGPSRKGPGAFPPLVRCLS